MAEELDVLGNGRPVAQLRADRVHIQVWILCFEGFQCRVHDRHGTGSIEEHHQRGEGGPGAVHRDGQFVRFPFPCNFPANRVPKRDPVLAKLCFVPDLVVPYLVNVRHAIRAVMDVVSRRRSPKSRTRVADDTGRRAIAKARSRVRRVGINSMQSCQTGSVTSICQVLDSSRIDLTADIVFD